MNSLKTVLLVVFGAALVYMVYVGINNNPASFDPESNLPGLVEMPGANSTAPLYSPAAVGSAAGGGLSPRGPATAQTSPPYVADTSAPPYASGVSATGSTAGPESAWPPVGGVNGSKGPSYLAGGNAAAPQPQGAAARSPSAAAGRDIREKLRPRSEQRGVSTSLPIGAEPGQASASDRTRRFLAFMDGVRAKLDGGRLDEAHEMLSSWYNDPTLSPSQAREVEQLLDQLAGTVIYSRQHWLEGKPYKVVQGDTLEQIAQQYNVPSGLLAKINGIRDPQDLRPGQELKVVRGPFDGVISLERFEITLMLNRRYAGRFPIGAASNLAKMEGSYRVLSKTKNPTYYYGNNQCIDANDPDNPLGKYLIGLDKDMAIHGTNDPANIGHLTDRGWISLGAEDIEDLYDILSVGSRITIRR